MAKPKKIVTANQTRSILSRYAKGDGMKEIGDQFDHSVSVIRRVLIANGVQLKKQGRPVAV